MPLTIDDHESRIQYEYLESFREMNRLQDEFDDEAHHGANGIAEQLWKDRIRTALREEGIIPGTAVGRSAASTAIRYLYLHISIHHASILPHAYTKLMNKLQMLCACCFAGIALSTQFACKKSNKNDEETVNQNKYVNDWIYSNMKEAYYWTDKIPANPDKTQSPDAFFYSLLKKPEDRYSWIQNNYQEMLANLSGIAKESGIDFDLFLVNGGDGARYLAGIVQYVKKGSPAAAANIARGDVFMQINGQRIAYTGRQAEVNNFVNLLGAPHTIGIHKVLKSTTGQDSLSDPRSVQLQVVELAENPVYMDSVYTIDGQKIGYFIYNFFAPDKGDNSASYDKQVDEVFARFKAAGIQHLVLDLRYNPGGDARSTQNLAVTS